MVLKLGPVQGVSQQHWQSHAEYRELINVLQSIWRNERGVSYVFGFTLRRLLSRNEDRAISAESCTADHHIKTTQHRLKLCHSDVDGLAAGQNFIAPSQPQMVTKQVMPTP